MIRKACFRLALLLTLSATGADARTDEPETWPCYWLRGRMMAYNGTPSFRIWPRGTHRLLGVVDGDTFDGEFVTLPPSLAALNLDFEKEVWANFRVCPIQPEHTGWMRMVVVSDAQILAVREYGTSYR